jgi:hypothetical protein
MTMKAILPAAGPKQSYYEAYVWYVRNILLDEGISIDYKGQAKFNYFEMVLDGKLKFIDYSNFHNTYKFSGKDYYKFQWNKDKHKNAFSFTKLSFFDWDQYRKLKEQICYICNSDVIISMQRPRAGAKERRTFVQEFMKKRYDKNFVTEFVPKQIDFWNTINDCLVHVCVPGARNDILDRGQLQCMAFGCCTISPVLTDGVAWNRDLEPSVHYIACKNDYSDLIEKVEWCKQNRQICIEIGQNAKKLFEETSTPAKLVQWLLEEKC